MKIDDFDFGACYQDRQRPLGAAEHRLLSGQRLKIGFRDGPPIESKFVDNARHEFNASVRITVTPQQFTIHHTRNNCG